MNKKQTQCPECTTVYNVSVEQLTIAQGMVCCPKCFHSFNGLLSLVDISRLNTLPAQAQPALLHHDYAYEVSDQILARSYAQQHLLDIFDRKIEHSNIDLHTYLNNLNYFSSEPIHQFPSLKLSEKEIRVTQKPNLSYYLIWSIINISLIGFLAFQILWFKPDLVARYPILSQTFDYVCQVINCQTLEQRYQKISINQLTIRAKSPNLTEFSGALINSDDKSMPLPHIVFRAQSDIGLVEYTFQPAEYLEEKYQGIERLPSETPFKFSFQVPFAKNQIQSPHLEIIQP
jgi:predicted Zn finger-like uncharacterized protein